jgi:hypothetical protein
VSCPARMTSPSDEPSGRRARTIAIVAPGPRHSASTLASERRFVSPVWSFQPAGAVTS